MSYQEYKIANFLNNTDTPFYSGLDNETLLGDGTRRSNDFVVPPIANRHDGLRIEWAGFWDYPNLEIRETYRARKQAVHDYHIGRGEAHILLRPVGKRVPNQQELENLLDGFLGFGDEVHLNPPRIPASSINSHADYLARVVQFFEVGSEISTTILREHPEFGESFVNRMYTFFDSIHELADAAELFVSVANYRQTESQFLAKLHSRFPNINSLPSSHELAMTGYSWVNERADHFFGSYRNLRQHLGLDQLRREEYTLNEARELLAEMCVEGMNPTTTDVYSKYPGLVRFIDREVGEVGDPFQVTLARFLGTRTNSTRLEMASLSETISELRQASTGNCLPPIRFGPLSSPIIRRLQHECVERGWSLWGLPVTASRLTGGLKPKRVKLEGRNLQAPPLIEQTLEDLSRAIQTYGSRVVRGWDPTELKNHEKRLSNNLNLLSVSLGLSPKLIHYDVLRIPWLERRDNRNRIVRGTECWIGWCRDLCLRHPNENPTGGERKAYKNPFNNHYSEHHDSLEAAFDIAREIQFPEWFVSHEFLDQIWVLENPFKEWMSWTKS